MSNWFCQTNYYTCTESHQPVHLKTVFPCVDLQVEAIGSDSISAHPQFHAKLHWLIPHELLEPKPPLEGNHHLIDCDVFMKNVFTLKTFLHAIQNVSDFVQLVCSVHRLTRINEVQVTLDLEEAVSAHYKTKSCIEKQMFLSLVPVVHVAIQLDDILHDQKRIKNFQFINREPLPIPFTLVVFWVIFLARSCILVCKVNHHCVGVEQSKTFSRCDGRIEDANGTRPFVILGSIILWRRNVISTGPLKSRVAVVKQR